MAKPVQQITIEGRNMVKDGLNSGQSLSSVFISSGVTSDPKIKEIEMLAKHKGVRVQVVSTKEIEGMSWSKNPQGVIAIMEVPERPSLEQILRNKRNAFIVLLSHIDYEQNLGAILRSAWAVGVDAVIASPSGVCELTPVVAKVSMGAAAYVPLIDMSMFQAVKLLHKYAVPVVGVEVGMGKELYGSKLVGPVAILMGGEAEGISTALQKECDYFINIPMAKEVASLNVSVATAVVLYEKLRQERSLK